MRITRLRSALLLLFSVAQSGCSASSSEGMPAAAQSPQTQTLTVGPEGGTIEVGGGKVVFPAGALAAAKVITISTTTSVPEGFVAVSKVFECEPSGTDFAAPVTMTMPFTDDGQGPLTMFWSAGADPTFKDVGGKADGALMTTTIRHFSSGFVGRKK